MPKRRSRSSVGTTEEEVERRKELRRLRQSRIMDELGTESAYDNDAKSISSIISVPGLVSALPLSMENGVFNEMTQSETLLAKHSPYYTT